MRGTRPYRVYVTRENGGVSISCTCPRFETTPCKHVWATLVALDREARPGPVGPARTVPAIPPRARSVAPWRARLDGLAAASSTVAREAGSAWPSGREVVYEIDLPATLESRGLVVGLFYRQRRKNGTWGRPKTLKVGRRLIEGLPEAADREALSLLLGGHQVDTYYSYDPYEATGPARVRLPGPLQSRALSALCATGRAFLRLTPEREPLPLRWDDGKRSAMHDEREDGGGMLSVPGGVLRRGGKERPIDAPDRVTASGLVLMDGRAAPFEHGGAFAWVPTPVATGGSRSPAPKGRGCRRRSCRWRGGHRSRCRRSCTSRRPAWPRVGGSGLPRTTGLSAASANWWPSRPSSTARPSCRLKRPAGRCRPSPAARPRPRRRGRAGPAERLRILASNARSSRGVGRAVVPAAEPPSPVVPALTREGWHVEAEGRVYRRPGTMSLSVTSGIDWFDLEAARCDFDGQARGPAAAPCRPSAAARRRRRSATARVGCSPRSGCAQYAAPGRAWARPRATPSASAAARPGLLDALLAAQPEVAIDAAFAQGRESAPALRGRSAPSKPPRGFSGELRDYQSDGLGWLDFLARLRLRRAAWPTTWAWARPCRCWPCSQSRRSARGRRGRPTPVAGRGAALAGLQLDRGGRAVHARLRVLDYTGADRARDARALRRATTWSSPPTAPCAATSAVLEGRRLRLRRSSTRRRRSRTPRPQSAKAARLLRADHRLALTGTPSRTTSASCGACSSSSTRACSARRGLPGRARTAGSTPSDDARRCSRRALRAVHPPPHQGAGAPRSCRRRPSRRSTASSRPEQRKLYDELRDHYRAALLERVETRRARPRPRSTCSRRCCACARRPATPA